ncbi:hypothetical protein PSC71_06920 [Devosia sp. J2-20]|uniref:hypothetical protein n=1 Tax=Devosia sp. J2-20 TaxID=3026161 RepID=UPI00249A124E|nr:hypothetical protein [Devosia sp. J2-20]WDR00485.1 hypothetical protein PSC71_06920 [Devosia sp. J2-20]
MAGKMRASHRNRLDLAHKIVLAGSIVLVTACFTAQPAFAYIGPGLGAGLIATIFGILGSIGLLIAGIIYFPIKRALKRRKSKNEALPASDGAAGDQNSPKER